MPTGQKSTRETIVSIVNDLIYHRGSATTSYADVAEHAGIGKGHVQYYFKSKDDLIRAVAEGREKDVRDLLHRWSLECGPTREALNQFIDMLDENAESLAKYGCPMGALTDELGKGGGELQPTARRLFDLFAKWLGARFRAVVSEEEAGGYAEHLLVMAQGASVLAHAYRDPAIVHRQTEIMRIWLEDILTNEQS